MQQSSNILKGSLYAITAFFFLALFGIMTKVALGYADLIWVSFITYFASTILLSFYVIPKGIQFLKSENYPYLIGRAIFGCIASFLYTISMQYIPIVNSTLLFNTAPIFIPILAILWLKKSVENYIWLAIGLGFLGIVVIIKPTGELFTQTGNLIGLLSGISLATAFLLVKLLTQTEPGMRIIYYYLGLGCIIQIPLLFFAGPIPMWDGIFYSCICGIVLLLTQITLVKGYSYAEASQIGIYQYAAVVFVGLLNWMIWEDVPPLVDILGVVLVASAGIIIIYKGQRAAVPQKNEA